MISKNTESIILLKNLQTLGGVFKFDLGGNQGMAVVAPDFFPVGIAGEKGGYGFSIWSHKRIFLRIRLITLGR